MDTGPPALASRDEVDLPGNAPDIPRVSLQLPLESDLVLVETTRERAPEALEEEPQMHRRGRVRPPRTEMRDEPLQMVETHKESSPPGA